MTDVGRLLRRSGTLPPLTWRGWVFDVLVALAMALAASSADAAHISADRIPADPRLAEELFRPSERDETGWPLMLLVVAPLVLRRRYPLSVLWVVLGTAPLLAADENALRLSFYACVVAAYSAAVHSPYRLAALASLPVAIVVYGNLQDEPPAVPPSFVPLLLLTTIAIAADGLRRWRTQADEGRERMVALERERMAELRRAADHERARIARELHDVVTHNVSMMVIQAGAARKVLDTAPDRSREALLAIEAGGRAAMTELRHVMGLLTMDSDGPDPAAAADLAPQPGLDRLDALVDRLSGSGVPVTLTRSGRPRAVPAGIELAAYRVVQEALTNTVKHAAGATALVLVEFGDDHLRVEVTDTGGPAGTQATTGGGHGLIGLRERLAVYGGTLRAGPRVSGGYRVDARIPWEGG
ncbi:sensor histidine kinase [Actinoplanes sp. CA-252034]|uniref:sensor histidine kinase n=1 Tax=Actinoplanes sp. CA-252034 TaxID=3239906 RepID=UPI003D99C88F